MDAIQEEYDENGSSSSGDSSDSDLAEDMLQIEKLRKLLAKSPYQYDSHVELMTLLRQQGDLDGAREARHNMSKQFPLTEALWLEWLGDELTLASIPEACLELRMLFETATEDYLSVEIWLQYARFSVERMSMFPDGMAFPRDVFERGIVGCGLHTSRAGGFWDAYREFEEAVLKSFQDMQLSDPSDAEMKSQVEAQYEKVDKLFRRQLAVPLIGMESTFQEYRSFSEKPVAEEDLPAYVRARKKLEGLLPFENQLQEGVSASSLEVYRSYIAHTVASKSDPSLTNTLYQRALVLHCLDTQLWRDYLGFLTASFAKVSSAVLPGHRQAVRNVPWEVEVWVAYVRAMERFSTPHEEIVMIFEKTLSSDNLSNSSSYLKLWTSYCDYLRRRVDGDGGEGGGEGVMAVGGAKCDTGKFDDLRNVFKRARENLSTYYGKEGDPTDSLARYQAGLEARCYGDMETARALWDDVMSRHGREAEFWLEYAQLERCYGDVSQCRRLLSRAVHSASDRPEQVCQALLALEREVGTLQSYEAAEERCAVQMKRVHERREKATEKEAQRTEEKTQQLKAARSQKKKENKQQQKFQQKPQQRPQQKPQQKFQQRSQQKPQQKFPQKSHQQRRQEPGGTERKRGRGTAHVFFDNSGDEDQVVKRSKVDGSHDAEPVAIETQPRPPTTTQPPPETHDNTNTSQTRQQTQQQTLKEDNKTESEPTPPSNQTGESQVKKDTMEVDGGGDTGSEGVGSKDTLSEDAGPAESRTVFVSNLTVAVTEEQLHDVFAECGAICDIRVVRKRFESRTNVYAYVEFTSCDAREPALRLDRSLLNERPMYVSECKERKAGAERATSQPTRVFGNQAATVYVSNIAHSCEEKELLELFQQCGEVKHVRIGRNKAGRARGYAYVEFASAVSAQSAVLKLDDHELGFRRIKVAISNPPKKPGGEDTAHRMEVEGGDRERTGFRRPAFVPHRAEKRTNIIGARKSQISLVPRVLARKKTTAAEGGAAGGGGSAGEGGGNMSNEDFRNMLLQKKK